MRNFKKWLAVIRHQKISNDYQQFFSGDLFMKTKNNITVNTETRKQGNKETRKM